MDDEFEPGQGASSRADTVVSLASLKAQRPTPLSRLVENYHGIRSPHRRQLVEQTVRRLLELDQADAHRSEHSEVERFASGHDGGGMTPRLKAELIELLESVEAPIDFELTALRLHLSRIHDRSQRQLLIAAAEALGLRANVTEDGEDSEELQGMAQLLAEDRLMRLAEAVLPGWKLVRRGDTL